MMCAYCKNPSSIIFAGTLFCAECSLLLFSDAKKKEVMTEPLSIFTSPPRSEQTATIPADLLAAYVELQRTVGSYYANPGITTAMFVNMAHKLVAELSRTHCENEHG